jgi:hypothetical protein
MRELKENVDMAGVKIKASLRFSPDIALFLDWYAGRLFGGHVERRKTAALEMAIRSSEPYREYLRGASGNAREAVSVGAAAMDQTVPRKRGRKKAEEKAVDKKKSQSCPSCGRAGTGGLCITCVMDGVNEKPELDLDSI